MKCHFIWDAQLKEKVLIPECYGSLHRDDLSCCTCKRREKSVKEFENDLYNKKVNEQADQIDYLQKELASTIRILQKITSRQHPHLVK
jgi:hypothetical protein